MTKSTKRNLRNGLLFVSPWIVGFVMFNVYPLLQSLYYSLCDYSVLNPPVYIGAGNYADIFQDAIFWKSFVNTIVYSALALPVGMILSLALALLLNCDIVARPIFRAIIFVPSLIPLVAMGIIWGNMFNADFGVINHFITKFTGLEPPNWLGDEAWMKPSLVIMGLWGVGNAVVIYLAGLQDVPRALYEAAEIDGANWWHKTWHVTLPMISPVIYFNLIIQSIFILQIFVVPYVVFDPEGGAGRSALFYTMYLLNQGFTYMRMGYACALAWLLFLLIAGLTYFSHRVSAKHVHYGGN